MTTRDRSKTPRHQRHGETERVSRGFEATMQEGFEWLEDNASTVVLTLLALLVVGGVTAAAFEWSSRQREAGQLALDKVERAYMSALGGNPGAVFAEEPANEEQAQGAREAAIEGYDRVIDDYGGTVVAAAAAIRAAEAEIDLGRLEVASERLTALEQELDPGPLRATALRLQGYALELAGRLPEAGQAYEAAGRTEDYPGRETALEMAGEVYLRAGLRESAIGAFQEVLVVAPVYAEQRGLVERLDALGAQKTP